MGSKGRCKNKTFMADGVKLESGEATLPDGRTIVLGRPAGDGEVHLNEITVTLEGGTMRLQLDPAAKNGSAGRRLFDPWRIDESQRDLYLATAIRRMAIGATESAEYAALVTNAAATQGGEVARTALVERAARLLDPANQQANELAAARLLATLPAANETAHRLVSEMWNHEALLFLIDQAQDGALATRAQERLGRFDNLLVDPSTHPGEDAARRLATTLANLPEPPAKNTRKTKHQAPRREPALSEEERERIAAGGDTMRERLNWMTDRDGMVNLVTVMTDPKRKAWVAEILLLESLGHGAYLDAAALKNARTREEALASALGDGQVEFPPATATQPLLDDVAVQNIPAHVATDPLFLRARAAARMVCGSGERRVLEKIAAAIQGRKDAGSRDDAEKTITNIETALSLVVAITELLRVAPHLEPSLALHPKDQERLRALSGGRWRPGRDLLFDSEQLLRAARSTIYAARDLRRDQESAIRSAKTARNHKRIAELERELLVEIPQHLLDLARPTGARRGGRGGAATPARSRNTRGGAARR